MTPEQLDFGYKLFASLANPARLKIIELLAEGPAAVKEIAEFAGLKQSMASQHLSILSNAGVVICNPIGNLRVYSLRGPRIARILHLVEEFHDVHLNDLRRVLAAHT